MVNKQIIGKIQLCIGIILLLIGILVGVFDYNLYQGLNSSIHNNLEIGGVERYISKVYLNLITIILGFNSFLILALSLLFITQGLSNKSIINK